MFYEKTPAFMPIIGQMRPFCRNYTVLWAIKVNKIPFFPISHEKNNALMHLFCKKREFSKNTKVSCPYFVKKTSILSKTLCSHVIYFMKTPWCHAHIWSKKTSILIIGQKSQYDAFFLDFSWKVPALMPIFCQYNP